MKDSLLLLRLTHQAPNADCYIRTKRQLLQLLNIRLSSRMKYNTISPNSICNNSTAAKAEVTSLSEKYKGRFKWMAYVAYEIASVGSVI